jgi:hypothetical protein
MPVPDEFAEILQWLVPKTTTTNSPTVPSPAAGPMPAELPISCDLRRFVQSENGRYHCALGRSKAHDRIREPRRAQPAHSKLH